MNETQEALKQWENTDTESIDFSKLEQQLSSDIEMNLQELEGLKLDGQKIGNPASLGETINNVIWEQFMAQFGVQAGEEFIDANSGKKLDLRKSKFIQIGDNFRKAAELDGKIMAIETRINSGKATTSDKIALEKFKVQRSGLIADHNTSIDYEKRYKEYLSWLQFDENGNIVTKYDRIDNEDKPVLKKEYRKAFDDVRKTKPGKVGSASKPVDETISVAEQRRNPEENAHMDVNEMIEFDTSDVNTQEMDVSANESKSDHNAQNWLKSERDGKTPGERFDIDEKEIKKQDKKARKVLEKKIEEGKKKGEETGKAARKAEVKRIGNSALQAILMELLASLVKDIVKQLVKWFMSAERKFKTFIETVKQSIHNFLKDIKKRITEAANTALTTIATAILGPIVKVIKKAWIFLKQGYNSVKEAILFLKNPNNANMPFSLKLLEVGKIIITGLAAGGAIVLGEVIEKALISVPFFAITIPFFGSLASIIGMFMGALVSGLIGALALNLIDRLIANKLKTINTEEQIDKGNEIISKQNKLIEVVKKDLENVGSIVSSNIHDRHKILELAQEETQREQDISDKNDNNNLEDIDNMLKDKKYEK